MSNGHQCPRGPSTSRPDDSNWQQAGLGNFQARQLANAVARLATYERPEKLLNGRNSYSKTDPDATFMRMKDGQLLPAYTIIDGSENQFIVNYTIDQTL